MSALEYPDGLVQLMDSLLISGLGSSERQRQFSLLCRVLQVNCLTRKWGETAAAVRAIAYHAGVSESDSCVQATLGHIERERARHVALQDTSSDLDIDAECGSHPS